MLITEVCQVMLLVLRSRPNAHNPEVPQWVSVKSNDSLTFEWYHNT